MTRDDEALASGASGDESKAKPTRPQRRAPAQSAYATGGGGVVLEHAHAAYLLAHLLLPDPLPGLGDEFGVAEVAFQANRLSPVDDAVITGIVGAVRRTLAVAVRRDPVIGMSDNKFAALWHHIVETTRAHLDDIANDRWRTGLVVAGPHGPSRELAKLANAARAHADSATFRAAVEAGPRGLKDRLQLIDDLTTSAVSGTTAGDAVDVPTLTWNVLTGIRALEIYLEGADARDRATMIGRLASVAGGADGRALWQALTDMASRYVPEGATVNEAKLRRDLVGVTAVVRSPRLPRAWAVLDELERLATIQVKSEVSSRGRHLTLPRAHLRASVAAAIADQPVLLVTGEPDTGKSALVAAVVSALKASGAAATALNLRDIPASAGELVALLGSTPTEVFGGFAVADQRVLVLDSAEAIQEAHRPVFIALASAAVDAGINVTVVGRDDAAPSLRQALEDAVVRLGGPAVSTLKVGGLDEAEVTRLRGAFAELNRIAEEPRAAWILTRPGLVDLLLRADAVRRLPAGPLAEADVFAAVWAELVRNREERVSGGAMPDEREQVLLQLARAKLLPAPATEPGDGAALASLRSDGLLRRRDEATPWRSDDFASDLIRDFSVAALLDRDGLGLLAQAAAPRWAIRAARLAIQARVLSSTDFEATRREIQASFDALAQKHGERWVDVPWESLLDPRVSMLLPLARNALIAEDGAELQRLMRLVRQRHSTLGALDPLVSGSVTGMLVDHVGDWHSLSRDLRNHVDRFLLEWLSGLVARREADRSDGVRVRARALLLADMLIEDPKKRLQALASLGVDLDEAVSDELREAVHREPHELVDCVEDPYARLSLALRQPPLLLELAEAYYLERERPHRLGFGGLMDDGIRDHRFRGAGVPFAAPYYGPFALLLDTIPREAIAFTNHLLDHAAAARVRILADLAHRPLPEGIQLGIGQGPGRAFVGDPHVWGWYRGNTVGPYPAMSALMALEDWADKAIAARIPIRTIVDLLLASAHSLATPGLVYGLLVRHLDRVTDELDAFLREPVIWELEFGRVTSESGFLTRRDDPARPGAGRRTRSPRDVVTELVLRAMSRGDEGRLDELRAIGAHLEGVAAGIEEPQAAGSMRQWAAGFDPQNYELTPVEGGFEVRQVPPADVNAALAARNEDLRRGGEGWRLLSTYALREAPPDVTTLAADIAGAREYADRPPMSGPNESAGPPAAVAMAAVQAHANGTASVPDDDLAWATSVLVDVMSSAPTLDDVEFGGSLFNMGADRSAGRGLAASLRPAFHEAATPALKGAIERPEVVDALAAALSSPIDEVRRLTAIALGPLWSDVCGVVSGGRCRHDVALSLALDSVRYARLGPWDEGARRSPLALADPVMDALREVAPRDLALDWLTAAVIAAADCAAAPNCQADTARAALTALADAHRRALPLYLEHHYKRDDHDREPWVVAVIREAAKGHRTHLAAWLEEFGANPEAVGEFLDDASRVATYDVAFRVDFASVWPAIADHLLDAVDVGVPLRGRDYFDDRALANVVPSPQIRTADTNIDATLDAARFSWISLDVARPRIERWMPHALGSAHCVDSLVQFLRTTSIDAQVIEGLPWVRRLIEGHAGAIARRSYFVSDWLAELRDSGLLVGELRHSYQVVVDALAAGGDRRAGELQALEE